MKTHLTIWLVLTLLLFNVEFLHGAPANSGRPTQIEIPSPTPYAISAQDGNFRVWERTVYELAPSGQIVSKKHHYTELATGLNYLQNGQWVESKEQIDIQPNGTASATQGQHQAYFPGDIYSGQIELVTPDGQHLQSRPMALTYFDGTNTVLIAELTNSIGVVSGNNQVIYPDAFTGFKADLVFTYKKYGFEQDIVLREQPPTPESLGLNPDTARLQVFTEFFSPPQPTIQSTTMPKQAGVSLTDQSLGFGQMQMIPGRAFLLGENATDAGARVGKQWVQVEGRQFLIEEVPVDAIATGLSALPMPTAQSSSATTHTVSKHLILPPQRLAKAATKPMLLARAAVPTQGFVLDYQTVNSSVTNFTFQGDTTYYINGTVNVFGTNVFEGGTVIKYTNSSSAEISMNGAAICQTSPYRPAVFTSKDDDSVGETISGSTGSPSGNCLQTDLFFESANCNLQNIRITYANYGVEIVSYSITIKDSQFLNVSNPLEVVIGAANLENILIYNAKGTVLSGFEGDYTAQNLTVHDVNTLANDSLGFLNITNSLLICCTNLVSGFSFSLAGAYNVTNSSDAGIFQTVGGGAHYLAGGSAYRNAGTTNIDPTLLSDLQQKTTYPPIAFTNFTFSVPTTFSPQAQRDTDAPDLGYHYDPLDYAFGGCEVDSNVTFTVGTAVGWFRTSSGYYHAGDGIHLMDNATATFNGTATALDYWVRLNTVQEQDASGGYGTGGLTGQASDPSVVSTIQANFLHCSLMSYDGNHFRDDWGYLSVVANNCEFWVGGVAGYDMYLNLTNCFFGRANQIGAQDPGSSLYMQNCTVHGSQIYALHGGTWPVVIVSCALDGITVDMDTNDTYCDYNAFTTNSARLSVLGAHDIVTNSFNWQSSWFGNYYLPSGSPLINTGNTNANYLGLYHFTTQTNQMPETNSVVDIGYHYVATDTNGNLLDYDGDGLPDYLEDANGNGLIDSGEIGWNITGDLGLKVIIIRPRNGSILP